MFSLCEGLGYLSKSFVYIGKDAINTDEEKEMVGVVKLYLS